MIELATAAGSIMSRKHSKNTSAYEAIGSGAELFDSPSTPLPASPGGADEHSDGPIGPGSRDCDDDVQMGHTQLNRHNYFDNSSSDDQSSLNSSKPHHHHALTGKARNAYGSYGQCHLIPNQTVQHHTVRPFHSSVIRPPPNITITTTSSSRESPSRINNTVKNINQRISAFRNRVGSSSSRSSDSR